MSKNYILQNDNFINKEIGKKEFKNELIISSNRNSFAPLKH